MRAITRAPRRARGRASIEIPADQVRRRHVERMVRWTYPERIRCLWYRVRLTVREMNYAAGRLAELQRRLPP